MTPADIIATLTPAMQQALRNGARNECAGAFETGRHTEQALIRRGLATPVIGRKEIPAYRRTGVYGRTTTVYDAYLGIEFTALGRTVATLITKES